MCGICGVVTSSSEFPITKECFLEMRDTLRHRGPDDSGVYFNSNIALGSRRLAILDLSANGHMPMQTGDGRYTIIYNGEVYNHADFRPELEAKGYNFVSSTDTETLLYLFAEYGPSMLDRLIGMFAIAIWDDKDKSLFIARDRLGVKPLVYSVQSNTLYFASEEKALLKAGISSDFNESSKQELLYFRYISGENTVFKQIKNLLPGHYMVWRNGSIHIYQYWSLKDRALTLRGMISNPVEWYHETFESAIRYRLISDVPVGVLLSGGLDSGTVATISAQQSPQIASFTVRFTDNFHDEGLIAKEIAKKNHLQFHELYVSEENELPNLIKEASYLFDAPLIHGSDAHILAISRYAKQYITVLLSGEGGDETLGGYVRYRPLQQSALLLSLARLTLPFISPLVTQRNQLLKPRLKKLHRFLRQGGVNELILYNSCDVLPIDVLDLGGKVKNFDNTYREKILTDAKYIYPTEPIRQAMYLDQHTFLQSLLSRNDRMTMGASIECRVPFLDHRLVEGLASLPTSAFISKNDSKWLLRSTFGAILPDSVLKHRKVGFSVPWGSYMRNIRAFQPYVTEIVEALLADMTNIPQKTVNRLIEDFMKGDDTHLMLIRQAMMMDIWMNEVNKHTSSFKLS